MAFTCFFSAEVNRIPFVRSFWSALRSVLSAILSARLSWRTGALLPITIGGAGWGVLPWATAKDGAAMINVARVSLCTEFMITSVEMIDPALRVQFLDSGLRCARHIGLFPIQARGGWPGNQQVPSLLQLVPLPGVLEYPLDEVALEPKAFLSRPKIEPPLIGEIPENAVPRLTENVHLGAPEVSP